MNFDVIGFGDADVDVILRVDRIPGHDEKVVASLLGEQPGGIVANVCCAASRLGLKTAFLGNLGADRFGKMAMADLGRYGVDCTRIVEREGESTSFTVIMLDPSGEKALLVIPTSTFCPRADNIDDSYIAQARVLHLTAGDTPIKVRAGETAKAHGRLVSVDLDPGGGSGDFDAFLPLLKMTDVAFANLNSLRTYLATEDPREAVKQLLTAGAKIAVVTLGSRGCCVGADEIALHIPAFNVPVKDTTGAGDCFNAAFLAAYLNGRDIEPSGRFASAAAALKIQHVGPRTGLPTFDEVEQFLQSRGTTCRQPNS